MIDINKHDEYCASALSGIFMGMFNKRLTDDDRKELFEVLFAGILSLVFLTLSALLLWAVGRAALALHLAQGYAVLWIVIYVSGLLVTRVQGFFRVDIYDHPDAFVISNLAVSCFLQVGWAAFAALAVHGFVGGTPVWLTVLLYLVGLLSCLVAFYAVSAFYQGHIYRLISLPLALVGFIVFGVWPITGRAMYGWFFNMF